MFKSHRRRTFKIMVTAATALAAGWGLAAAPADAATAPTPPFAECPAIGQSPSCEILLVVNADNTVSVVGDPSVGPYDGSDDTLVGVINDSAKAVNAVTVSGPGSDLSGFDGDGICSGGYGTWAGSSGCPYGPTGYEGPGTSFVIDAALPDSAEVDFAGGLAPGKSAYFSLEGALTTAELTAREGGLTIYTISGKDSSPLGQAGKEAHGSPRQAKECETPRNQKVYKEDEAEGRNIAAAWQAAGLTTASALLTHFLDGTGAEVDYSDTSPVALEVAGSSAFSRMNHNVIENIGTHLDFNPARTQVKVPHPDPLHALAFLNSITEPDLYWAFRYTHLIKVDGKAVVLGSNYVGSLTYAISESYGFNEGNTFLGIGTDMRFLQTTCGAPFFSGGAQWFTVKVTVTVPFTVPVNDGAPTGP
jgi:hypothetical protein